MTQSHTGGPDGGFGLPSQVAPGGRTFHVVLLFDNPSLRYLALFLDTMKEPRENEEDPVRALMHFVAPGQVHEPHLRTCIPVVEIIDPSEVMVQMAGDTLDRIGRGKAAVLLTDGVMQQDEDDASVFLVPNGYPLETNRLRAAVRNALLSLEIDVVDLEFQVQLGVNDQGLELLKSHAPILRGHALALIEVTDPVNPILVRKPTLLSTVEKVAQQ